MRKSIFLLTLLLAGCGGGGSGTHSGGYVPEPVAHAPEISGFTLSPSTVPYMEGQGTVIVAAQLSFEDDGRDVQLMVIETPDGDRTDLSQATSAATGTLTAQLDMATDKVGIFYVEVWLVDKAGDSSNHLKAQFAVGAPAPVGGWTNRLTGMGFVLNDVLWSGRQFITVGGAGRILTSDDGTTWVERPSPTFAELAAVASRAPYVVAVGYDATVLLSTDGGDTWKVVHGGSRVRLAAVAIDPPRIVAGGMDLQTGDAVMLHSPDLGANWASLATLPQTGHFFTDLVYANGLFVAGTDVFSPTSDARVMVSLNGLAWNDIVLRNEVAAIQAILHDGGQFVAVGSQGTVFVSTDGYNWTERQTPVLDVDYLSVAWDGSRLVAAGGITWWYWWMGTPRFERPVGLSSVDGGVTWQMFDIDGYYQSRGLAWGNGRFVSVGQTTPVSGVGAIYTSP